MKILIFGASATYGKCDPNGGWAQRLRKHIDENSENIDDNSIFNLGISGDTTEELLRRFDFETIQRVKKKDNPIFIFSIGVNDSQYIHDKQNIRITPEKFRANLRNIVRKAQKFSSKIVFLGLQPIDESRVDPIPWDTNKSYKTASIEEFNNIVKEVCDENNIFFINILPTFQKIDYKPLLYDGLHPTSEGHQEIFELIRDFLIENKLI